MLYYLVLVLMTTFIGRGIIRISTFSFEDRLAWYLSPVLTLMLWTVFLALGIHSGHSVKSISMILWPISLFLLIYGWPNRSDLRKLINEKSIIVLVIVLPVALMAANFYYGIANYPGNPEQDGWSYVALGSYLWNYVNGTAGGLAPLHQFAASLSQTRLMSSALLAFLSPFGGSPGDTQSISSLYLSLVIFTFASSCAFFSTIKKLGRLRINYLVLVTFSGWLLSMLYVNNYDNALVLPFLPVLAGLTYVVDPSKRGQSLIIGTMLASVLFIYPELTAVIFFVVFLFILQRIILDRKNIKNWLLFLALVLAVFLLLVLPQLQHFLTYVLHQLGSTTSSGAIRPGAGFFPHLLRPSSFIPAYSGFFPVGASPFSAHHPLLRGLAWATCFIVSTGLILSAIGGAYYIFGRREWALVTSVGLLCLASLYMLLYTKYDYGCYKFILLNWWAVCFLAIWLFKKLAERGVKQRAFKLVPLIYMAVYVALVSLMIVQYNRSIPVKSLAPYRELSSVKNIVGNSPIMLTLNDTFNYDWALYFLRDEKLFITQYRGYSAQPWVVPFMKKSTPVNIEQVRYLITDFKPTGKQPILWHRGPYYLSKVVIQPLRHPGI